MRIQKLKNKYKGDIWVLGSGAQMDMYTPDFFKDKITIGVNLIYKKFPCKYVLIRHYKAMQEAVKDKQIVVSPDFSCDADGLPTKLGKYKFADELMQCGFSSMTAIDLARYMGADRIIILGCEGYGNYTEGYPSDWTSKPGLNRTRYKMGIMIEEIENKYKIRIDWVKLIPTIDLKKIVNNGNSK